MKEYNTELLHLYNMDCMELLKQTPDNYYSLALVDPPYGIGEGNKTAHGSRKGMNKYTTYIKKKWDDMKPNKTYFNALFRVSKNQIIWGGNYFVTYLKPSKGWIFWDKDFSPDFSFSDGELAYSSFDIALKKIKIKRSDWTNVVSNNPEKAKENAKIHITQKPVKLYKWLLENYAKPGDKILDTHMGSGSIAIACHYMGFDLTACELDADYFQAAIKRIKEETSQISMF